LIFSDTLQEVEFAGSADGLRATTDPQFTKDIVYMLFNRADSNNQFISDGLISVTNSQQAKHFELAFAERFNEQLIGVRYGRFITPLPVYRGQ